MGENKKGDMMFWLIWLLLDIAVHAVLIAGNVRFTWLRMALVWAALLYAAALLDKSGILKGKQ